TMRAERLALDNFERLALRSTGRASTWCHEITSADRERFAAERLKEVGSGESVDADLRNLRTVFNVLEEWHHRAEGSNPFAGRKKATVGERRKRAKKAAKGEKQPAHYTRPHIVALLRQADLEMKQEPDSWDRRRLRALVYFEAYTGARIGEVLHL